MITSTSNPRVKELVLLGNKAKERKKQGLFLVEGKKMFEEAPKEWIRSLYVTEAYVLDEKNQSSLLGMDYETVSDHVMKAVCKTQTPQGILAVVSVPEWDFYQIAGREDGCFLLLEGIQDPGNLGTMMRTAEAAGISAVILNAQTVDLYNPKTVRATMGSIYRMPCFMEQDFAGAARRLKEAGAKIYAAHLRGGKLYDEPDYQGKCGFLIGSEGSGLSDEAAALADEYIKIPMGGKAESLNAAVAAAILMYEANRKQRR